MTSLFLYFSTFCSLSTATMCLLYNRNFLKAIILTDIEQLRVCCICDVCMQLRFFVYIWGQLSGVHNLKNAIFVYLLDIQVKLWDSYLYYTEFFNVCLFKDKILEIIYLQMVSKVMQLDDFRENKKWEDISIF